MDLRVLQYFLAVTREQSITAAAESLHLSQPTLSRQLKEMEDELGKQLFLRGTKGSRRIELTEEGMILRKRAEEILSLVQKTENEITASTKSVSGDVYIGAGETDAMRILTRAAQRVREKHPNVHFHISSGDWKDLSDQLDKGLIDMALSFDRLDEKKHDFLTMPVVDTWGVLMRRDSPLAQKEFIEAQDLWDKPLILSRQIEDTYHIARWLQKPLATLNIVATYNLIFNASMMVSEGMGYAVTLDKLVNVTGDTDLTFRLLAPTATSDMRIVWKGYQIFSKAAEVYLQELEAVINEIKSR